MLDETPQTNGKNDSNAHSNILDLLNSGSPQVFSSSNPLEDILFGDDSSKNESMNGIHPSNLPFFNKFSLSVFRFEFHYSIHESH